MLSSTKTQRVTLTPKPGFVVKTRTTSPGSYIPAAPSEDKAAHKPIPISVDLKVFINVCFDRGVPPPPTGASEEAIRKAMSGEDESAYFVPVVISDGREILDRAGKRSLVFDTVFHPSINDRGSKDADYRTFITEIALERIEEKSGLVLGREISTPNISSKGPLTPRTVLVPYFPSNDTQSSITGKPLVEEIDSKPAVTTTAEQTPQWRRDSPGEKGVKGRIIVEVPKLTRTLHSQSTLDIEPNRIILHIPGVYALDIPLDNSGGDHEIDVNEARAQWIVEDKKLVVTW